MKRIHYVDFFLQFEWEMNPTLGDTSYTCLERLFHIHDREGKVAWRDIITWHADIVISPETQIELSGPSLPLQSCLRPDRAETSVTRWLTLKTRGIQGEIADIDSLAHQNELFQIQMRLHSSWLSSPDCNDFLGTFLIPSSRTSYSSLFKVLSSCLPSHGWRCSANRAGRLDSAGHSDEIRGDSFLIHNVPESD